MGVALPRLARRRIILLLRSILSPWETLAPLCLSRPASAFKFVYNMNRQAHIATIEFQIGKGYVTMTTTAGENFNFLDIRCISLVNLLTSDA